MSNHAQIIYKLIIIILSISLIIAEREKIPIKKIGKEIINVFNTHKKSGEKVIKSDDYHILTLSNITVYFESDSPLYNENDLSFDFYNVKAYVLFKARINNGPVAKSLHDSGGRKNITFISPGQNCITFKQLHFFQQIDNSIEYDHYLTFNTQSIDWENLIHYTLFKELIDKYGEYNFMVQFQNIWMEFLEEIAEIYPISDAHQNYRLVTRYMESAGIYYVDFKEEPTFTIIKVKSFRYKNIHRSSTPYTRVFNTVKIIIEYHWNLDYENEFIFETITFSRENVYFGRFYPFNETMEKVIKYIITKTFASILKEESLND